MLLQHYLVVDLESSKGSSSGQYNTWITSHICCHMQLRVVNGSCGNHHNQVTSLSMLVLVSTDSNVSTKSEPLNNTFVVLNAIVTSLSFLLFLVRHMVSYLPVLHVLLTIAHLYLHPLPFSIGNSIQKKRLHGHHTTHSINPPLQYVLGHFSNHESVLFTQMHLKHTHTCIP